MQLTIRGRMHPLYEMQGASVQIIKKAAGLPFTFQMSLNQLGPKIQLNF